MPPTVVSSPPIVTLPTTEIAQSVPDVTTPEPLIELESAAIASPPDPVIASTTTAETATPLTLPVSPIPSANIATTPTEGGAKTQLQQMIAKLLQVQTNTLIELPQHLSVIHLGKPNDQIPPDIDVSGFPNSDIVSRVHADIRVEGDGYYIEDVGSSNGTYVNNFPLPKGNRHRLRPGDRIALGKGDKVTFIFQVSS